MVVRLSFSQTILNKITKVIISHPHADYAAGISVVKERLGCAVYAHTFAVQILEKGDEIAMAGSLPFCDFYEPCPPCKIDVELKDNLIFQLDCNTIKLDISIGL